MISVPSTPALPQSINRYLARRRTATIRQPGSSSLNSRGISWRNFGARIVTDDIVEADLRSREFVPEVERIVSVSSFACPSTWQVQTNRGPAELVLKGEEDIRRLSQIRLLIADANGIQFLVRDLSTLDKQSRKLLDRFL